jgi:glucose-1-phosphate cytidylyltransferase
MKVVLFCGGLGTRLREYSDTIPKPLVNIGPRPILWHLMRYYASFGHEEFVLCLGHGGDQIRQWFLEYDPRVSEDFSLSGGKSQVFDPNSDVHDWNITFVDTGIEAKIGERLWAVRHLLSDEEVFLANYSDQLSNLPLDHYYRTFQQNEDCVASFAAVKPSMSFHLVQADSDNRVSRLCNVRHTDIRINGGFFFLKPELFDHMKPGEELVEEPFRRLMSRKQLLAFPFDGFWKAMDTYKDKMEYDRMYANGDRPWMSVLKQEC